MQKIVKYPIFLFFIEISDWTSTSNQQIAAIFVQSEQKNQTLSQGTSTSPLPRHLNRNRVKWAKKNCFFWMNWFRHYCCYPFVYHSVIETPPPLHHIHRQVHVDSLSLIQYATYQQKWNVSVFGCNLKYFCLHCSNSTWSYECLCTGQCIFTIWWWVRVKNGEEKMW